MLDAVEDDFAVVGFDGELAVAEVIVVGEFAGGDVAGAAEPVGVKRTGLRAGRDGRCQQDAEYCLKPHVLLLVAGKMSGTRADYKLGRAPDFLLTGWAGVFIQVGTRCEGISIMSKQAKLDLDGKSFTFPVIVGSEGEQGVDISTLRQTTNYITLDDGYSNTGSCVSNVTFIDGDKGILRYRGYPIEELAENSTFIEAAYLIIYGELPNMAQMRRFSDLLTDNEMLHESMKHHFESFPATAHPMAILSSMITFWYG